MIRMDEYSEKFNRDRKYKKERSKSYNAKNTITELKNTLEGFNNKQNEVQERISNFKYRIVELTQTEQQKEKNNDKKRISRDPWGSIK